MRSRRRTWFRPRGVPAWLPALLALAGAGGCGHRATLPEAVATLVPMHVGPEVCIPGGTFEMGHAPMPGTQPCDHQQGNNVACSDFAPVHPVTLSPYCIDTDEVTFRDYLACIDAGYCQTPWQDQPLDPDVVQKLDDPH